MDTEADCYPKSIILQAVYCILRFILGYRNVEEIMKMRGVHVDHATIQRWVYKFTPLLESEMKKRKGKVGVSWRLDETYIKVKNVGCYLYRAVDKLGNTVDSLLARKRQRTGAQSFLIKAISNNCRQKVINIDKSDSNTAAIKVNSKIFPCTVSIAMDLVGGKWKAVIFYHLKDVDKRYNELRKEIPAVTEMTLSLQLKQVEKEGLILGRIHSKKSPIKVVYSLTDFGRSCIPLLNAITEWGNHVVAQKGEFINKKSVTATIL